MPTIYESLNPGFIILILLGAAGLIALISWIIYRIMHPRLKSESEKPSEEQILHEEMDRYLKPIEDDKIAKEVSEYKDEEDEKK